MRYCAVALVATLACFVSADYSLYRKQADGDFLEKQRKIISLLVGLGADTETYDQHKHVDFPFNKPEFYKKPEAVENFMKVFERGLLDRRGVFTMFCHKNRHDTFKVFELFYYAKDFDTFMDIAKWARYDLHPMQWSFAFVSAVFHREDTRGMYVPPLYEIFPQYFVQSEIMHKAITAKQHGETYAKYLTNGTGWEWSWHSDMLSGPYKSSSKWVGDNLDILVTYFREDVGLSNFISYFHLKFAAWMSNDKYSDIHFSRRGEIYYAVNRWLKNRYNLERMSNRLPPVETFETYKKLPGYNPHLQDLFGRTFLVRTENMVTSEANPDGSWDLDQMLTRIHDIVDSNVVWEFGSTGKFNRLSDEKWNALDEFSKIMFGTKDAQSRKYYKPPYYHYLQAVNDIVKAPNDRDYTYSTVGTLMTQARDPTYFMILASIDQWFEKYMFNLPPYTKKELGFPGVSIEKFEVDKLETFYERYDFELTNGISFAHRYNRVAKKFEASQFRLNHKPYHYKLHVKSDKEYDAVVRIYLGPMTDTDGREYSFDQMRRAMIPFDYFRTKVKSGDNVLERHSHQMPFAEDYQRFRPFYEKLNKSIETKEPFYYNEMWQCGAPKNLMIPKGWKEGKEYGIFAIITKFDYQAPTEGYYPCHHNFLFDQYPILFPIDRPIRINYFFQDNMLTTSVKIYHDFGAH